MTEKEKYEAIKNAGELVMRTLNLSRAAAMAQQDEKEVCFLQKAYKEATRVVADYPDMEASFVVYVSGATPLLQYYQRQGQYENALHHCMQMVLKMRLLTRKLYEERSCTMFTQTVCFLINIFLETARAQSFYEKCLDETKSVVQQLYDVLYILQDNLKKVNPASLLFNATGSLMTTFEQIGVCHDEAMTVDNLNGLINRLADSMDAFVFDEE